MKKSYIVLLLASVSLMATACGGGSSEPETTEKVVTTAQEATEATEATEAAGAASSYSSNSYQRHEEADSDFEEFLKENDPDSYNSYQTLEDNWNSGNWDPENGFLGGY